MGSPLTVKNNFTAPHFTGSRQPSSSSTFFVFDFTAPHFTGSRQLFRWSNLPQCHFTAPHSSWSRQQKMTSITFRLHFTAPHFMWSQQPKQMVLARAFDFTASHSLGSRKLRIKTGNIASTFYSSTFYGESATARSRWKHISRILQLPIFKRGRKHISVNHKNVEHFYSSLH